MRGPLDRVHLKIPTIYCCLSIRIGFPRVRLTPTRLAA